MRMRSEKKNAHDYKHRTAHIKCRCIETTVRVHFKRTRDPFFHARCTHTFIRKYRVVYFRTRGIRRQFKRRDDGVSVFLTLFRRRRNGTRRAGTYEIGEKRRE